MQALVEGRGRLARPRPQGAVQLGFCLHHTIQRQAVPLRSNAGLSQWHQHRCHPWVTRATGGTGGSATDSGPDGTRARLNPQALQQLEAEWGRTLGLTPAERNKVLARCLQLAAAGDPVAYDIVRQDSKDFMTGVIDAQELYDRFMAVFALSSLPTPPANPTPDTAKSSAAVTPAPAAQPDQSLPEAETWFKELALLLPAPAKRLQLIQQCIDPTMAPHPTYMLAVKSFLTAKQAAAEAAARAEAEATAAARLNDDDDDEEEMEEDEYDEYEDEDEDEEDEGQDMSQGWQRLDREKMQRLVKEVQEQAALQNNGVDAPPQDKAPAKPARKRRELLTGLEGVHFNSVSARPAKARRGKKSGLPAVQGEAPPGAKNVLVWLRQDLRLHDNPALSEAARLAKLLGGTLTFLYVFSPDEDGDDWQTSSTWRPAGGAFSVWQQQALTSFNADVVSRFGPGSSVVMRKGPYLETVVEVATALDAWHVFCNRRYEPGCIHVDTRVWEALAARGYQVHTFNAALLREPWDVKLDMRTWTGHFGTFTPFWNAWKKLPRVPAATKPPKKLPVAKQSSVSLCGGTDVSGLGMYSPAVGADGKVVDWGQGIRNAWDISEAGALQALDHFLASGLHTYETKRQFADASSVSKLSPYLRSGLLSPRFMWQMLEEKKAHNISKTFSRRLIWRELAYWQLHHWPDMTTEPIRQHYVDVEWDVTDAGMSVLDAWKRGQTGFPLVDAGMRELWATGWMQQNVRMVCSAFLTECANIPWVEGAKWFHDTLVDADLAINSMMWQNSGKSGLDQWNWTMDPAGKSQDPAGKYIRRWVPELSKLDGAHVHKPWLASAAVLEEAGVQLGVTYPHRVLQGDLQELREKNIEAIQTARALNMTDWVDPRGYDLVVAPKGSTVNLDGKKVVLYTKEDLVKRELVPPSDPEQEGEEEEELLQV